LGWKVEGQGKRIASQGQTKARLSSGLDWFELRATMDFDGASADVPALLEVLASKSKLVRLSDGGLGLLPEEWMEQWGLLLSAGEVQGDQVRFSKGRAFLLDALLSEGHGVETDEGFTRWHDRLAAARLHTSLVEPATFVGELRGYQREGLGWLEFLASAELGGCLADDMGLGKTIQVLAFALARKPRAAGPTLVVAPKTLLFNWESEGQRFAPSLSVLVHHGTARTRSSAPLQAVDLVVTTYGTLRQDIELLREVEFDLAVLDEAQAIKNPTSQSAKATRLIKARMRLALTGTPVENRLGDLLSIFEYLNPGLVEGSRALKRLGAEDNVAAAKLAARALQPFLLRRTKEEVLRDLPPKTEQTLLVELEGAQAREYAKLREHYRRSLLATVDEIGLDKARMNVLEALLRLRQAACHVGLIDAERKDEPCAKLETLLPLLEEVLAAGHKALVFSQFTSFLSIVRARLDELGMKYEYLDGRTRDRAARVTKFQEDPEVGLFLVSLKAGGTGLNLTAADYVFLLDPWWNPAVERQAVDRAHRIGQTRAVSAYRLVARGTVEEKVLALQDRKRELADALFAGEGRGLREMTREDLEWVLS
jgi:SNF2 family DNA or RNA helicase